MPYVTVEEWKAYRGTLSGAVQVAFTQIEDDSLQNFIDQAETELNRMTGKTYEAANATRYFRAAAISYENPRVLMLDKWLLSVSTLTNGDGTVISAGDYWLLPRSEAPYRAIELKSDQRWRFDTDGEVSVAGAWGFMSTADETVKRVTMRLAEFFYQKRGSTGETQIIGEDEKIIAAQYPKDVQDFTSCRRCAVMKS